MTLWQTSLTYQIWVWLCDVYEDSTLHRYLAAAGRWEIRKPARWALGILCLGSPAAVATVTLDKPNARWIGPCRVSVFCTRMNGMMNRLRQMMPLAMSR